MQTHNIKTKTAVILILTLLLISMASSVTLAQLTAPTMDKHIPTYAFINVYPNPAGVGQTVTVNFFLSTPPENGAQGGKPTNMSVVATYPDGTEHTLGNGNFTGDQTGGTFTTFTPTATGNYSFQFFYGGQTLPAYDSRTNPYGGLILDPSQSNKVYLTVQLDPVIETSWPTTPLPDEWWQTPVSAQNVQQWYQIMGPWLGLGANTFAQTGSYNSTSYTNPYTPSVTSGHVLWSKVWATGGVAGGDLGGNEISSSYWATRQYQPQYAPVVMNGIMYSQQYPDDMGTNMGNGIIATDLYTGKTLWVLNTTNPLRSGMMMNYQHINQYGALGPFIWTTGTLPAADTGGNLIGSGFGSNSPIYSSMPHTIVS